MCNNNNKRPKLSKQNCHRGLIEYIISRQVGKSHLSVQQSTREHQRNIKCKKTKMDGKGNAEEEWLDIQANIDKLLAPWPTEGRQTLDAPTQSMEGADDELIEGADDES